MGKLIHIPQVTELISKCMELIADSMTENLRSASDSVRLSVR
jgi:hypothetical protein